MKLNVTESNDNKVRFTVTGLDIALANGLRRMVISEIPTMAIDDILFYENTSILNDEVLASRLGQTPLKTDLKTYNHISECTCKGKGCAKCAVTLSLDIKGPGTVYTKDLKSTDPEIEPVYDNMPLAKLTPEQEIKFEARAELGTGKRHMKWQAGIASYEIKEDGSLEYFIETFHQHELDRMVEIAFDLFNKKIEDLKEALK